MPDVGNRNAKAYPLNPLNEEESNCKTRRLFARSVAFVLNAKFLAKQMELIIQGGNRRAGGSFVVVVFFL